MNKLKYFWNVMKFDWELFKLAIEQNYPYTYNILKIIKNQIVIWYYKIVGLFNFC
jgi:hypothetical protein